MDSLLYSITAFLALIVRIQLPSGSYGDGYKTQTDAPVSV